MNFRSVLLILMLSGYLPVAAHADTAIETETAQIGEQGEIGISQSYEYARAKDGTSGGTLTQFEYGITDRSEILIEPFFYTWDHPKGESKVDGLGDLEITPSYEFVQEDGWVPAMLAAFKYKVPTGSVKAGSSGKPDYLPYLILGQHYEKWIFNVNLGVNIVTPTGEGEYKHAYTYCMEAEREISNNLSMFLEYFRTEDQVPTTSAALEYEWTKHMNTFVAAGYSNQDEAIYRAGFNLSY